MAPYVPTYEEWCMVVGSFFLFALLLFILVKAFPVLELPEEHDPAPVRVPAMPPWKRVAVGGSLALGVALIATGVLNRTAPEFFHPPAIWLSGIVLLLSVPFQLCVLPERTPRRRAHAWVGPHIVTARQANVQRYRAAAAPRVVPRAPVTTSFPPLPPASQRGTSISA